MNSVAIITTLVQNSLSTLKDMNRRLWTGQN